MDTIEISEDLHLLCVPATSFPEGIIAAHQKLHSMIPFDPKRQYYGISRPENGEIVYFAAAQELEKSEAKALGVEKRVLPAGTYIREVIENYAQRPEAIGEVFQKLLETDGLDPKGYCLEWYINERDVHCLIRIE